LPRTVYRVWVQLLHLADRFVEVDGVAGLPHFPLGVGATAATEEHYQPPVKRMCASRHERLLSEGRYQEKLPTLSLVPDSGFSRMLSTSLGWASSHDSTEGPHGALPRSPWRERPRPWLKRSNNLYVTTRVKRARC
jgi:hypothetical protein